MTTPSSPDHPTAAGDSPPRLTVCHPAGGEFTAPAIFIRADEVWMGEDGSPMLESTGPAPAILIPGDGVPSIATLDPRAIVTDATGVIYTPWAIPVEDHTAATQRWLLANQEWGR